LGQEVGFVEALVQTWENGNVNFLAIVILSEPLVYVFSSANSLWNSEGKHSTSKKRKKGFMRETQIGDLYQVKKKSQNNNKNYY